MSWTEFPAGPQLLEALNVGSIDFGHAGDSPPVFAQAANVPFVYVAASAPSPSGAAIIVPLDSSAQELADLRGKKLAFTKGSSANFLVLRALQSAGMTMEDIQPVFLSPSDGRAALISSSVDAWAVWDPYFADVEEREIGKALLDGTELVAGREFYFASRDFAQHAPDVVETLVEEIDRVGRWSHDHPQETAEILAPAMGVEVATLERAERRRGRHAVEPMTNEIVAEQQQVADSYFQSGLIPREIDIREAIFSRPVAALSERQR